MRDMRKLGFLGCGKMASALLGGVVKAGVAQPGDIVVSDQHAASCEALAQQYGVSVAENNIALAEAADVLLLCVKPGDAEGAMRELGATGALQGKLVISIVTGLSIDHLQALAGEGARIVRVMPNTPALVGHGAAAMARGASAGEEDAALVATIMGAVGRCVEVKEELLDAVTGLSGSGPAYIYLVIEALADGGVKMGLPRNLALELAAQTVRGAAEMVLSTGLHPAVLKDQVTSPGGTTITALAAMEEAGVRSGLIRAVEAATTRSQELGK